MKNTQDLFENTQRIKVLEKEIDYARTQIRPHATGHIHTAIAWMEQRLKALKKQPHL